MLPLNSRKMPGESEHNKKNEIIIVMDGVKRDTGLARHSPVAAAVTTVVDKDGTNQSTELTSSLVPNQCHL